jgi:hypothetical protein
LTSKYRSIVKSSRNRKPCVLYGGNDDYIHVYYTVYNIATVSKVYFKHYHMCSIIVKKIVINFYFLMLIFCTLVFLQLKSCFHTCLSYIFFVINPKKSTKIGLIRQTNSYFLYWTDVQCLVPRWKQPGLTHQTVRSLGISSRSKLYTIFNVGRCSIYTNFATRLFKLGIQKLLGVYLNL